MVAALEVEVGQAPQLLHALLQELPQLGLIEGDMAGICKAEGLQAREPAA
jgi:hypothetical protein